MLQNLAPVCFVITSSSDSFGREFLVKFPSDIQYCLMYVYLIQDATNVAVWTENGVLPGTRAGQGRVRTYACKHVSFTFAFIFSDKDVSVNVVYGYPAFENTSSLSYAVYPTDMFSTEYMLMTDNYSNLDVKILIGTMFSDCTSVLYFPPVHSNYLGVNKRVETRSCEEINNIHHALVSGLRVVFDKPATIFGFIKTGNNLFIVQYMPLASWGTSFKFPSLATAVTNQPAFEVDLVFTSFQPHTIVNLTGGFNDGVIIHKAGDEERFNLTYPDVDYFITSNSPISVGIFFKHTDSTKNHKAFTLLPPVTSFVENGFFTVVPVNEALKEKFDVRYVDSFFTSSMTTASSNNTVRDSTALLRDFYAFWNGNAIPMYGLTVLRNAQEDWIVVPGFTGSRAVVDQEPVCVTSFPEPNDDKDNDCDRLFDEDSCYTGHEFYPKDADRDGAYSEDCEILEESPNPSPKLPECFDSSQIPPGQCWMPCGCSCTTMQLLAKQKNMTREEIEESQAEHVSKINSKLTVPTDNLTSKTSKLVSAEDERTSAAGIGYVGIGLLSMILGLVVIMDITAIIRDLRIFWRNLKEGCQRLWNFIRCR